MAKNRCCGLYFLALAAMRALAASFAEILEEAFTGTEWPIACRYKELKT
jgi:cyanate permease